VAASAAGVPPWFKFAWAYRLYNYVAIMLGATPPPADKDTAEAGE
jgi:uncharacterized membrane protein